MNCKANHGPHYSQQGVVLLEALIAILIFSMGILAIVGLQAAMVKNTSDAKYRADASFIAQQKIGQMWADPDPSHYASHVEALTDISSLLPAGTRTVNQTNVGEFLITITWQQPGDNQEHKFTTVARITGG